MYIETRRPRNRKCENNMIKMEMHLHMMDTICERFANILVRPRAKEVMFLPIANWPQSPSEELTDHWRFVPEEGMPPAG